MPLRHPLVVEPAAGADAEDGEQDRAADIDRIPIRT